jgi:prevent-host-death family protein
VPCHSVLIYLDKARQITVVLMTSPDADHWQIQEAKQRFSEMIRAVTSEGPQVITRHGEDVAVVVDIGEYRRLTRPTVDLTDVLLRGPKLEDGAADVFAEIEAERKVDFGRAVDFEAGG